MKKAIVCTLLTLSLSINAFALEVPTDTVVQNLNGSQQTIKTYTVSPEQDPETLIEEPFELEGFLYSFANIVKTDNAIEETKTHTETITVETEKNDLSLILEQLSPTIEYDDGSFRGTLALDHTSIVTEAAGYTTKSYTVTETKTIGQLDRNDMSYIPATTVKDGRTLALANVEWQVTGTDLVGDVLIPSSYQAVATYSGKAYYSAATGYVTTADYVGEVSRDGIESTTYVLTYIGVEADPESEIEEAENSSAWALLAKSWPLILGGAGVLAAVVCAVLFFRSRRSENENKDKFETDAEYEDGQEVQIS